jgi:hypothetical protein
MSNLFFRDGWDFFTVNQLMSFDFKSIFFWGVAMCTVKNAALEQVLSE